MTEISYKT